MAATWLANHVYVIEMLLGTDVPEKEDSMSDWVKHDGKVVTVPCTSILRKRGDLLQDLRIYIDISPVFA